MKRTGIIVLNWNAAEDTISCVRQLQSFLGPEATIYVVDNNSAPEHREKLRQACHDVVFIWNDKNLGYAGGNNVGIRRAVNEGHEFVLLMNNDARIEEMDFWLLVQAMDAEPNLGAVGPIIRDRPGGAILNAGGRDIGRHYISHFKEPLQPDALYNADYVSGTVCLIRACLFDMIGMLDESYFFSGEIADFCTRVKEKNFRTAVQPFAEAVHDLSASHGNRSGIYTYYTVRNRFLYIRKHLRSSIPVLFPYWTALHLRHAFRCWREKKQTELRMVLKGLAHGLSGRFGPLTRS
jgi:GT2 family glycosyltransferase